MAQQEKKSLVKDLIDLGKQKGQLTNQDILDAIGEADLIPKSSKSSMRPLNSRE